jgi:hypothetical protein
MYTHLILAKVSVRRSKAALHSNTGLSYMIRPIVEKHSEMPWLDSAFTTKDRGNFRPRDINHYTVCT